MGLCAVWYVRMTRQSISYVTDGASFSLVNIHVGYQMLSVGILIAEYYSEIYLVRSSLLSLKIITNFMLPVSPKHLEMRMRYKCQKAPG